jgi:hypothetical protein
MYSIDWILVDGSLNSKHIRLIKDPNLINELQNYETRQLVKSYKFGVLYCAAGQTAEEDMFSNSNALSVQIVCSCF